MSSTPPATTALGRLALGAAGLIVGAAVLFGVIGLVTDGDDGGDGGDETPAASEPTEADPTPDASPTDGATPTQDVTSSPSPTASEPSPTEPPATTAPSIDPASVSVQVLDAVLDDGGATAGEAAATLREDGYQLIAENNAVRVYEQTTVFYTDGNEDAARQIAAAYGYQVVEPAPDNLSTSVDVHLVVGRDA